MKTQSKLVVESFTNKIGQTLNPGDSVVAVTTGWHRVSVFTGKFAGVRRRLKDDKIVGVRVEQIPVTYREKVYDENGEHEEVVYKGWDRETYKSIYEKTGKRYNLEPRVRYRNTSLKLNRLFRTDTNLSEVTDKLI